MKKTFDIITALDTCVDLMLDCGSVRPSFGQAEKLIGGYHMELGGSSGIFVSGAAKLGLSVAGVGVVGKDIFGEFIIKKLKDTDVDTSHLVVDPAAETGLGVALCLDNNDRSILTYSGTIGLVAPEQFTDELLASTRHVHVSSFFLTRLLQPAYRSLLIKAKSYGATVSVDTNWDPDEQWDSGIMEILELADIFLPNESEAMAITRTRDIGEAMEQLTRIVPIVALKRGKQGACVYAHGKMICKESLEVNVVDTVGAGDNFDAGFVYGFLSGMDIEQCLKIGGICGSYSVTKAGGVAGQVTNDELMKIQSGLAVTR